MFNRVLTCARNRSRPLVVVLVTHFDYGLTAVVVVVGVGFGGEKVEPPSAITVWIGLCVLVW